MRLATSIAGIIGSLSIIPGLLAADGERLFPPESGSRQRSPGAYP